MFPYNILGEIDNNGDGFDTGILVTVLVVLAIIALVIWLFRALR